MQPIDCLACLQFDLVNMTSSINPVNLLEDTFRKIFKVSLYVKDLSCDRATDQFSTLNNSAKLTYKVGLMSNPEMNLLNNSKIRA